jgi:gentisate 1,2-dioxygenase
MLENIVPVPGNTLAGATMVLQVIDPGFHSVPLHLINSKLYFVSGQAVVEIRSMLPVEDSALLFGID